MKITITKKDENKLLGRVEVEGEITFDKVTPSNQEVGEYLAKELNAKRELIVIKGIHTIFSTKSAKFTAVAYQSQETKDKYEVMTKHLRKKAEEKAKAESEAQAAKAQEEKPAEEKKEEPAPEKVEDKSEDKE